MNIASIVIVCDCGYLQNDRGRKERQKKAGATLGMPLILAGNNCNNCRIYPQDPLFIWAKYCKTVKLTVKSAAVAQIRAGHGGIFARDHYT